MRRIGIDVGGTNTDAVLVEGGAVVASVKTPTTEDVTAGVREALRLLVEALGGTGRHGVLGAGASSDASSVIDPVSSSDAASAMDAVSSSDAVSGIDAVVVGTTHFTNAVVQRSGLEPVAALRIGLPSGRSLPPFADWPEDLARVVRGRVYMVEGGHEVDGRPLVPFDEAAVRAAAEDIRDSWIRSVALSAVFSPLTPECEEAAATIMRDVVPDAHVTLSHELGRIGLLGRENAALLNAALAPLARRTTRALTRAVAESGIDAPLYLTQNDGTVMSAARAEALPVYSFSSGPTNSMRGAAFLSGLADAMVADVGGTTTDVGHLKAGFPREAGRVVEVGGVRTLFRMPDLLSLPLGGGTLVDPAGRVVGPESVGYRLTSEARVFGGRRLTATDVAVAAGLADVGDARRVRDLAADGIEWATAMFRAMIEEGVDRMKADARSLPLLAVGGGAFLVPKDLPGIAEVLRVPHAEVANAVGAAIAQVSGEVDRVFSAVSREHAVNEAEALARERAHEAGADADTLKVVEVEDLPLAYLPGDARRVRVRVVGEAAAEEASRG